MKCPKCKNEINDDAKFCPYCGAAISSGKGLLSDDDCPATDFKDAVILKPKDFKESKGITDDGGLTFAERELLNERNNSEYKEYEQRDDRFDYFANDSRYNDFSRFEFDKSVYSPSERASTYDQNEEAEKKELEELNKSRATKSAEAVREFIKNNQKDNKVKIKEIKPKIKRTDTTASWEKDGRTKKSSKIIKIVAILFVLCMLIGIIPMIFESFHSTSSKITSMSDLDDIDVSYEIGEIADAFRNYDYKTLMLFSYEGRDLSSKEIERKIKDNELLGGEKWLCQEEFYKFIYVSSYDLSSYWTDFELNFIEFTDYGEYDGYNAVTAKCKLSITYEDTIENANIYTNLVDCGGNWYYITDGIN